MKEILLGIAVILFAIALGIAGSGMGVFVFVISFIGLLLAIKGFIKM